MTDLVRVFTDWLHSTDPALFTISLIVAQPIATFVHELGHASVPLAATKEPVAIRIGRLPSLRQTRIGRLQLMLHWYPAYPYGLTGYKGRLNRRTRIMFVLGGPTAHAAFGALLTAIGLSGHLSVLTGVGVVVFCEAFSNLIPFTRHGFRSDGAQLWLVLRGKYSLLMTQDPAARRKL